MKIEKRPITDIHVSEYNPRVTLSANSPEYQSIKKSIEDYGVVEPIIVNEATMCCIGGHQRLAVLRDMGEKKVECVMVHVENSEKEKALCIALNKIKGEWDEEKLNRLLEESKVRDFELGFADIDALLDDESSDEREYAFDNDDYGKGEANLENSDVDCEGETAENSTVIKIGVYKFEVSVSEYNHLIGSIRDNGIFNKNEIIDELRRRLCCD